MQDRKQRGKEREKKTTTKDEVKNELVRSLVEGDVFKNGGLDQGADKVTTYDKAILVVKG